MEEQSGGNTVGVSEKNEPAEFRRGNVDAAIRCVAIDYKYQVQIMIYIQRNETANVISERVCYVICKFT